MNTLILPFLSFLTLGTMGRWLGRTGSSILAISFSTITTIIAFQNIWQNLLVERATKIIELGSWIGVISLSFLNDALSLTMSALIALITCLVITYSVSYMWEDPSLIRFLSYLSFFSLTMLILVQGGNLVTLFLGWEGVGTASYLLINFWYTRVQAGKSAIKAVAFNRVGDIGLFIAIAIGIHAFGTSDIVAINEMVANVHREAPQLISLFVLALVISAMAKSAQILLHPWLPDAMEGPTPVSSLLHSATMVTAGIFLLLRMNQCLIFSPYLMNLITIIGLGTAIISSLIGMTQYDIKKVIAYSTNSQLGFMMFLIGMGLFSICFYHLTLHAFFKCALFLCSGVVIHGLEDQQDMRKYGGLSSLIPATYGFTLINSLSLIGWPFMSGFYSKDLLFEAIIAKGELFSAITFLLAGGSAILTAFYSIRLLILTFWGKPSFEKRLLAQIQDGDGLVMIVLIILSALATTGGYLLKDIILSDIYFKGILSQPMQLLDYHFIDFLSDDMKFAPTFFMLTGAYICIYVFQEDGDIAFELKVDNYTQYIIQSKKFLYDTCVNYITLKFADSALRFFYFNIDTGILEKFGPNGIQLISEDLGDQVKEKHTGELGKYISIAIIGIISIALPVVIINFFPIMWTMMIPFGILAILGVRGIFKIQKTKKYIIL